MRSTWVWPWRSNSLSPLPSFTSRICQSKNCTSLFASFRFRQTYIQWWRNSRSPLFEILESLRQAVINIRLLDLHLSHTAIKLCITRFISFTSIKHVLRQISPVRSSDEGSYQCQINTEPKMSRSVALVVLGKNKTTSADWRGDDASADGVISSTSDQDLKDSPNLPPPPPFLMTDETTESARTLTLKILGPSERLVRQGSDVTLFCTAALQQASSAIPGKNIELAWWQGGLKLNEKYPIENSTVSKFLLNML